MKATARPLLHCTFVFAVLSLVLASPQLLAAPQSLADRYFVIGFYEWGVTVGTTVSLRYIVQTDSTDRVTLEYSTDSARTWSVIDTLPPIGNDLYEWTVPNDTSSTAFLRIAVNDSTAALSDRFVISRSPVIFRVMVPDTTLVAGSMVELVWHNPTIPGGTWFIDYSTDSVTWKLVAGRSIRLGENRFQWSVPHALSSRAWVRVRDENGLRGMSTPFAIVDGAIPSIRLLSPAPRPGVLFRAFGSQVMQIRWELHAEQVIAGPLSIEYREGRSAQWTLVARTAPRDGIDSIWWRVPVTPTAAGQIRVRSSDGVIFDTSRAELWVEYGELSLLRPAPGEILRPGEIGLIEWRDSGITAWATIEVSSDLGATWNEITETYLTSASGIESMRWEVPRIESDRMLLRVHVAFPEGILVDTTDGPFRITTAASVVEPASADAGLVVRPVPATGTHVTLEWSQSRTDHLALRIASSDGRVTRTQLLGTRGPGTHRIDIAIGALPAGLYAVRLTGDREHRSATIVVHH